MKIFKPKQVIQDKDGDLYEVKGYLENTLFLYEVFQLNSGRIVYGERPDVATQFTSIEKSQDFELTNKKVFKSII